MLCYVILSLPNDLPKMIKV